MTAVMVGRRVRARTAVMTGRVFLLVCSYHCEGVSITKVVMVGRGSVFRKALILRGAGTNVTLAYEKAHEDEA